MPSVLRKALVEEACKYAYPRWAAWDADDRANTRRDVRDAYATGKCEGPWPAMALAYINGALRTARTRKDPDK